MARKHETLYKLTDKDGYTMRGEPGETLWIPGNPVWVEFAGKLCHEGCLHAYRSPLVAVLCDPRNGPYLPDGKLWEARGVVGLDNGLKVGCKQLTTIKEIDVPKLSTTVRVRTAIKMALRAVIDTGYMTLTDCDGWAKWAAAWLDGRDRTRLAANRATDAANTEVDAVYSAGKGTLSKWMEKRHTGHTAGSGWHPEDVSEESVELTLAQSRNAAALAMLWVAQAAWLTTSKRKSSTDAAYHAATAAAWAVEAVRLRVQADLAAGRTQRPWQISAEEAIENAIVAEG